jgi:hypothetical protein
MVFPLCTTHSHDPFLRIFCAEDIYEWLRYAGVCHAGNCDGIVRDMRAFYKRVASLWEPVGTQLNMFADCLHLQTWGMHYLTWPNLRAA